MASDYPMYRDRDAEAQSFADRRGLSGEIRVADAPERKGVEILAPRAGTSRQMGEDSRPRDIGDGRGAGEAKAAVERQPRRGMFDGFRPRRSEEHTSELQSLMRISYAIFCLQKKKSTVQPSKLQSLMIIKPYVFTMNR